MTAAPAIEFSGVWKSFQRHRGQLLLSAHVRNLFALRDRTVPFHALKGVSFRMEHGESLAVVGTNGAGKSTLLSLVAGLVPPDRGTVGVNGRVAALLEFGSGFHPDLSGVEIGTEVPRPGGRSSGVSAIQARASRATMTGTWANSVTAALTEPSNIPANPPLPWLPTTTSWADSDASTS